MRFKKASSMLSFCSGKTSKITALLLNASNRTLRHYYKFPNVTFSTTSRSRGGNLQSIMGLSGRLVGAIDQGTSSSRFLVFSADDGKVVASHQVEIKQQFPREGWVELDPVEIFESTLQCMHSCCEQIVGAGGACEQLVAVGVTNQRETTIVWDRATGRPLHPAVVWLDSRAAGVAERVAAQPGASELVRRTAGLPINPYFSALKIMWLMENVESVREAVKNDTLQWDEQLCKLFGVPLNVLPDIKSSAEKMGEVSVGPFAGVPITACIGDQQSALLGQLCTEQGDAKNTYGTGTFLLVNTGTKPRLTQSSLLTTVAFKLGADADAYYALEGAGSMGGTAVRWLRDNLGIIESASEVEALAARASSDGPGACVFVPCFSGLNAPHWDPGARAAIVGLTGASGRADIARAALTAVCCQTREMLDAVRAAAPDLSIDTLKVDGGMTANNLLLQLQSDLLGCTVVRSQVAESTALGAVIAAGLAALAFSRPD